MCSEPSLPVPHGTVDVREQSPLALAFVGDAVLSLLVRARLVGDTRLGPNALHRAANGYVSARAQSLELPALEPLLTEEDDYEAVIEALLADDENAGSADTALVYMGHGTEQELAVLRRGRNASKATVARHATAQEYRASTGLECLLGWLYLRGQTARVQQLFDALWAHHEPSL